jgi:hypothetical protein
MYRPIFLPEAQRVPPAVREMEAQIIQEEGPYHVAGVYLASEHDAALRRRWYAERRVRREALQKPFCAWCHERFATGDPKVPAGTREIHETPCAAEYTAFTAPRAVA